MMLARPLNAAMDNTSIISSSSSGSMSGGMRNGRTASKGERISPCGFRRLAICVEKGSNSLHITESRSDPERVPPGGTRGDQIDCGTGMKHQQCVFENGEAIR